MGEGIEFNGLVKRKKSVIRPFTVRRSLWRSCQAQTRYHAEMQSSTVWSWLGRNLIRNWSGTDWQVRNSFGSLWMPIGHWPAFPVYRSGPARSVNQYLLIIDSDWWITICASKCGMYVISVAVQTIIPQKIIYKVWHTVERSPNYGLRIPSNHGQCHLRHL